MQGEKEMSDHDRVGPSTYLTPEEAKAFHNLFVMSMGFFVLIAVIAHILVWAWRPWFPGTPGYQATAATSISAPATPTGKA
jgi:light-harvesting complex 1 beta chain